MLARPRKGRGAASDPGVRFERLRHEAVDDGWGTAEERLAEPGPATEVLIDRSRGIIARNDSPDIPFDRSINPYQGCEHGCVYCYARPSHAFWGLSPGLDFETRIVAKPDAAGLLRRELARPSYACAPISLGANTDPYQPVERRLRITRAVLEVLAETRHPVGIVTKSDLVLRDLDLLASMARDGLARVDISLTTLDRDLARRLEPRASAPHRRLAAMRTLAAAGVPVGVMAAPVIPALNDHEIEMVLGEAAAAGALGAGYVLLRLPLEVAELFTAWLHEHRPARAARVLSLLRQCRGGRLNDAAFGSRMQGGGPYARLIAQRFAQACRRFGLDRGRMTPQRTDLFRPPRPDSQLSLF